MALESGSIAVRAGEVVALLGDNGAGKSTLVKVLSGALRPTEGELRVRGQRVNFHSPSDADAAGVATVYQDLALCPNLSIAHNLVLGDEPVRRLFGLIPVRDDREALRRATVQLGELGVTVTDHRKLVEQLSGGQRQTVAIARAVAKDVSVVLLDEPTAALGVAQTRHVLNLIGSVARRGTGVILISHDLPTIFEVADRVVVLRLGRVIASGPISDFTQLELMHLMAGIERQLPAKRKSSGT